MTSPRVLRRSEIRVPKRQVERACVWKAWLPVPSLKIPVSTENIEWFALRSISKAELCFALRVLRLIRKELIPVLSLCEDTGKYMFLIHERNRKPHIDVTFWFSHPIGIRTFFTPKWSIQVIRTITKEIAGIYSNALCEGTKSAIDLICEQSAWYVKLIHSYDESLSDIELLKQIGQYLHFFSNMSQLRVS